MKYQNMLPMITELPRVKKIFFTLTISSLTLLSVVACKSISSYWLASALQVFSALICSLMLLANNPRHTGKGLAAFFLGGVSLLLLIQLAVMRFMGLRASPVLQLARIVFYSAALTAFLIWIWHEHRKLCRSSNPEFLIDHVSTLIGLILGRGHIGRAILFEVLNLIYLLTPSRWLVEKFPKGAYIFTNASQGCNRRNNVVAFLAGIIFTALIYSTLSLWSPTAALIIVVLCCYVLASIGANIRALPLLPSVLDSQTLLIRNGLWYRSRIDVDNILSVELTSGRPPGPVVDVLSLRGLGDTNCLIRTIHPVEVEGPAVRVKSTQAMEFWVDNPKRLIFLIENIQQGIHCDNLYSCNH